MKELYYFLRPSVSQSSLYAWQREVYHAALMKAGFLFTREGIEEFAEQLQKKADALKGLDRKVEGPDWGAFKRYGILPSIAIGNGLKGCTLNFYPVVGSWASE